MGRIHPHLEGKVVAACDGGVVPRGEVGELLIRGYSVMTSGYYGDPRATAEAIDQVRVGLLRGCYLLSQGAVWKALSCPALRYRML